MSRVRAKTFADRLPAIVPEEEPDVSQLSDAMVDVLYPGRRARPFRIGLVFEAFDGPNYARALELAHASPAYQEATEHGRLFHHAAFDWSGARELVKLYEIVGPITGTEVLVDGKRAPYARELWLPLFWLFVREEPS